MDVVVKSASIVEKAIGLQKIKENVLYRPFKYIFTYPVEDGVLIYNTLSNEVIHLEEHELRYFCNNPKSGSLRDELIHKWYLVPENHDDHLLCSQMEGLLRVMQLNLPKPPITNYTIFTTTDCNARCFYCFEAGARKKTMSAQTAYDVAKFIVKSCKGEKVKISWFGGEPLYNSEAIDIICGELLNNKIEYSSKMVTNGYLFSNEIIDKAIKCWKLDWVQITLDGTEKVYNRVKNYIYKDINAYQRVMSNIELLLKSDIMVQIRLNMDQHNESDLYILIDEIYDRFKNFDKIRVYAHLLFEFTSNKQKYRSGFERHILMNKYFELEDYLIEKKLHFPGTIDKKKRIHLCQADGDDSTTILPDGKLGKCEHFTDSDFWGNIYDDIINTDVIDSFKKRRTPFEHCRDCPMLPDCSPLERCPGTLSRCDELDRKLHFRHTEQCVRANWDYFKKDKSSKEKEI